MELGILIATVAVCIICQASFAASEIALVAAAGVEVRAEHGSGVEESRAVSRLLERRDRMVALMLTGNNLATVVAAAAFTSFLHEMNPRSVFWAPIILAPITLLLGESIPKMLAVRTPLVVARFAARPLNLL